MEPVLSQRDLNDVFALFPIVVPVPVAWGDMDAFGHVNNTVYFRYFETGRIALFEKLGALDGPVGIILASTSCRFRAPVTFPDTVHTAARVVALGVDRMRLEQRVWSDRLQTIAAHGEAVVVCYDYGKRSKISLPEAWLRAIVTLQDDEPVAM